MGQVEGLRMKRGIAIAAEAPARVHHDSDESKPFTEKAFCLAANPFAKLASQR